MKRNDQSNKYPAPVAGILERREDSFMTTLALHSMRRIAVAMLATVLAAMPAIVDGASATYEYDTKGRVSKITYDDGTVVDYAYDLNGNRTGGTKLLPIGSVMAAGGAANLTGAGFQVLGGLAQMSADFDTGLHNVLYGGLNMGASLSLARLGSYMLSAGRTFSQRMFNSEMQAGLAGAGFISDGITYLSPEAAPQQANCTRP